MKLSVLLPLIAALLVSPHLSAQNDSLVIEFTNIKDGTGRIWVGIYTSEADFLDRTKARLEYFDVDRTGTLRVVVDSLEIGREYALGVFQDLDQDHDLNRNWLGLPTEPFGMSAPLRSYFRAPRFEEMAFKLEEGTVSQIQLKSL